MFRVQACAVLKRKVPLSIPLNKSQYTTSVLAFVLFRIKPNKKTKHFADSVNISSEARTQERRSHKLKKKRHILQEEIKPSFFFIRDDKVQHLQEHFFQFNRMNLLDLMFFLHSSRCPPLISKISQTKNKHGVCIFAGMWKKDWGN